MATAVTTAHRLDTVFISLPDTACELRQALRAAFPGQRFSVRCRRYSCGSSIDVRWTNGPATAAVERIAKPFAGTTFDGMDDSHNPRYFLRDGQRMRYMPDHVFCERETTIEDEQTVRIAETALQNSRSQSTTTAVTAFERRAMALADQRRYAPIDTMHWHTAPDGSNAAYLVRPDAYPLESWPLVYHVTIHPETDHQHTCDCLAGQHGKPCKHVGIALLLWQRFDRAGWLDTLSLERSQRHG